MVQNAVESRLKKNELLRMEHPAGPAGSSDIATHAGSRNMIELIAEQGRMHQYKDRQVIYTEGNHALRLFYVQRGRVKTYKTNDSGKELVTGMYNAGEFFGYVPILEDTVYKETAETLGEAEIATIPKDSFEELIYTHPDALRKMMALLAGNIAQKEEQLLGLAYNSLRKKVANALLMVFEKYQGGKNGTGATIDITRENLATIAGTAKESLIRTLSDFKEEQMIDILKGEIVILDEQKLRQLRN
jgi:CRP/FNR family cyclic AMP-dependent transcriptional regulator